MTLQNVAYTLSIPGLIGWSLAGAIAVAAVASFLYRQRVHQEIFPLPFIGRWVRLGVLQQYVLHETFWPVLLSVLALSFFLLLDRIYDLMDFLMANWSLGLVAQIMLSLLPFIFALTIPIATLVGVLLGIGRLAVENEIRACQTSGVHLFRIFFPLIIACAVLSAMMILVNYEYAPRMLQKTSRLISRVGYEALSAIPPGIKTDTEDFDMDAVFFYGSRDEETGEMLNVRLMTEREAPMADSGGQDMRQVFVAARGRVVFEEMLDLLQIHLYDGAIVSAGSLQRDGADLSAGSDLAGGFSHLILPFPIRQQKRKTDEYRGAEIIQALRLGRNFDRWANRDEDDYQEQRSKFKVSLAERTAIPLACVAFVLLGIPLAIFTRPSGKATGIVIAFLLVMLYYWMLKWGSGLAEEGNDLGLFIIFLPNVLMAGLGLILFRRAVRL